MGKLPNGYTLEQDQDGDWILLPPKDVTIFSAPGEGLLIGSCDRETALKDALDHLDAIMINTPSPQPRERGE